MVAQILVSMVVRRSSPRLVAHAFSRPTIASTTTRLWHTRYTTGSLYHTTTLCVSSKATAVVEEDLNAALDDILGGAFPTNGQTTGGAHSIMEDGMVRTKV